MHKLRLNCHGLFTRRRLNPYAVNPMRSYVQPCTPIRTYLIYVHLWAVIRTYARLSTPTRIYVHLWALLRTCAHLSAPRRTYGHFSAPKRTYPHLFAPIRTYPHLSCSSCNTIDKQMIFKAENSA